jgi:hypothetical protein
MKQRVLWVEDARELDPLEHQNAARKNFEVVHKRNLEIWNFWPHLADFVAVVFAVTLESSDRVFRNIQSINDHKISSGDRLPLMLAILPASLLERSSIHFQKHGCGVLPKLAPKDVFPFLRALVDIQDHIEKHGVIVWRPSLIGNPIVFGLMGLSMELSLSQLERRIWRALQENSRKIVFMEDIASAAGCKQEEVRVCIQRIRSKFDQCARKIALPVAGNEFIETIDGGYRLNATIRE